MSSFTVPLEDQDMHPEVDQGEIPQLLHWVGFAQATGEESGSCTDSLCLTMK